MTTFSKSILNKMEPAEAEVLRKPYFIELLDLSLGLAPPKTPKQKRWLELLYKSESSDEHHAALQNYMTLEKNDWIESCFLNDTTPARLETPLNTRFFELLPQYIPTEHWEHVFSIEHKEYGKVPPSELRPDNLENNIYTIKFSDVSKPYKSRPNGLFNAGYFKIKTSKHFAQRTELLPDFIFFKFDKLDKDEMIKKAKKAKTQTEKNRRTKTTKKRPRKKQIYQRRPSTFPAGYAKDPEVAPILKAIKDTSDPIFVTGKAGTGKSTLVKYIRDCGDFPNTVVLAPTGIAAINITGQTIHSFFRLPFGIVSPASLNEKSSNTLWRKVDTIIIDEVSMVRADIIDGINFILKRERSGQKPFGGVKLIFIGDFHQLPPVVKTEDKHILEQMGYASQFAYHAKIFEGMNLKKFTLEKVHRQSEVKFLNILSDLRQSANLGAALEALNKACCREHRPETTPLILTGTNAAASDYNDKGLSQTDASSRTYIGKITNKFDKEKPPAPYELKVKVGARVMALKNDVKKQWVNGSLGTIKKVSDDCVSVLFDHSGETSEMKPNKWENVKYEWDEKTKQVISVVTGSYEQIPLTLAWAVTIHKAQGLTLDDVRVDLGGGAFASGQAYVALSRARTLDGLSLAAPLKARDIIIERGHEAFLAPT